VGEGGGGRTNEIVPLGGGGAKNWKWGDCYPREGAGRVAGLPETNDVPLGGGEIRRPKSYFKGYTKHSK
jgi:hypothetical protein